jgi:hypothetical protein
MPSPEEIDGQKRLLATHRRTLAYALEQLAKLSSSQAPTGLLYTIDEARDSIRRIKGTLSRWGIQPDDHPDDLPPAITSQPVDHSAAPEAAATTKQAPDTASPPPAASHATQDDDRPYDVFISYSHADKDWVRGWLVPRLKAARLAVCTDHESFDIGVPALINMENAVAGSRHTLLVLTPKWVNSQWTRFESLLVQHEDPAGVLQRTLPVLRQPCEVPRRIAMLTYADLTGASDDEAELGRLLDAIRQVRRLPDTDIRSPEG